MESEGEGDDDYDGHLVVRTRAVSSDSEEEIFTTEPRGYEGLEIWSDGWIIVLMLGLVQILVIWYLLRKKKKKKKKLVRHIYHKKLVLLTKDFRSVSITQSVCSSVLSSIHSSLNLSVNLQLK